MNPCDLNIIITAVANHLYANLSKEDFFRVNVFLSELSKTMFSMEILRGICLVEKLEDKGNPEDKKKT